MLVDATRRALYDYVRSQPSPVSREEAAGALTISRSLAAFHLDRLVDAGLLTIAPEGPATGRRERGRPPKRYAPATAGVSVSIPARRYELIGEILAEAVAADPADVGHAARQVARATGQRIGRETTAPRQAKALAVLDGLGYRPEADAGGPVELNNCPFRALAARHPSLVCGLNQAFVTGLLEGLAVTDVHVRPVSRSRGCCVELALQH